MYQHPSDWHNNGRGGAASVIRQAKEQEMGVILVREPRFVELNNEISDDVASRIDLAKLHDRYVR